MAWRKTASKDATPLSQTEAQEVARVAYELWESRGRIHGGDQLDWLEAERIVRERRTKPAARKRTSAKP